MNPVPSLVPPVRIPSNRGPGLCSDQVFAELLSLHQEMIVQLRLERLSAVTSADFLTGLIVQHEKTAAMLRAQLENHEVELANDGVKSIGPV